MSPVPSPAPPPLSAPELEVLDWFEDQLLSGAGTTIPQALQRMGRHTTSFLAELVHRELEFRLKGGDTVRVEEYLAAYPEINRAEWALELIAVEYALRKRTSPKLSAEEYLSRFPQWKGELDSRLSGSQELIPARLRGRQRLNCPQCKAPIQADPDRDGPEVQCPSCGSGVKLELDRTSSWLPERLPRIGKFQLLRAVGKGAFATVYRAEDTQLGRIVAIKIPRSGRIASQEDEDRFLREARNVARLRHPGIVPIFEVGQSEGLPYLVSEFIDGITLADALSSKQFDFRQAAELMAEIAAAVDYAHSQGVVHRDLKPSNVMLEREGRGSTLPLDSTVSPALETILDDSQETARAAVRFRPRVTDFGLARHEQDDLTLTVEGAPLGTPAYMSPEQARGAGHDADGRADVYSLGVMLYQLIVGELPFRGTLAAVLEQVLYEDPRSPRLANVNIPVDLETIALRAMAKDPGRRYPTAAEFEADLRRWLRGEPILARPVGWWEHWQMWMRRHPIIAGLSGATALLILILVGFIATVVLRNQKIDAPISIQQVTPTAVECRELAKLRLADGDWRGVRDFYNRARQLDPGNVNDCDGLAIASAALKDWQGAVAEYDQARQLEPHNSNWPFYQAYAFLAVKDYQGYQRNCNYLKAKAATDFTWKNRWIYAELASGRPQTDMDELVAAARELAELNPGERLLGAAQFRARKYAEALEVFEKYSKTGVQLRAWDKFYLSMIHFRLGNKEVSRECFTQGATWALQLNMYSWKVLWYEKIETDILRREAAQMLGISDAVGATEY